MTKQDEYDFTQFKGSFDSAMSPDSDFTERMKQMLERESGAVDPQRRTTVIASPSRSNKDVPVPGRRTHPLTIAASILIVFAVVVSSIWVLSGSPLEGEYGSAPSGIATLPADAEVTPGPDVALSEELVIPVDTPTDANQYAANRYTLDVIDGVIYTTHNGPDSNANQDLSTSYVTAWDAETGDKLWEIEGYSIWDLQLADGVLVALRSIPPTPNQLETNVEVQSSTTLIGLDSKTGEQLWEREIADGLEIGMWELQFLAIDELVITVGKGGSIYALDLRTGEQVWSSTFDPGTPWPTRFERGDATISFDQFAFVMTEWNHQIAIANGDGAVQIIDPSDGETVATHNLGGKRSLGYLSLHALPNGLLLTHGGESYQMTAFDPETGNTLWEREIDGDLTVSISDNGMIAVNSHIWDSGSIIMRLIGRGGHNTHQFTWLDGTTGEDVLSTERGRVDGPAFAITDGEYLCSLIDEFVCYDRAGTRHTIANGPWAQAFFDDGNLYFDRDDGVYRVELP